MDHSQFYYGVIHRGYIKKYTLLNDLVYQAKTTDISRQAFWQHILYAEFSRHANEELNTNHYLSSKTYEKNSKQKTVTVVQNLYDFTFSD